jgi:hypothetical protein
VSERASDAQVRMMFALFNELGLDRDQRLAFIVEELDENVSSSSEMSAAEVHRIIDRLDEELRHDPSKLFSNAARAKARKRRDLLRGLGAR